MEGLRHNQLHFKNKNTILLYKGMFRKIHLHLESSPIITLKSYLQQTNLHYIIITKLFITIIYKISKTYLNINDKFSRQNVKFHLEIFVMLCALKSNTSSGVLMEIGI